MYQVLYMGLRQLTSQNATRADAAARCASEPRLLSGTTSVRARSNAGCRRPRCSPRILSSARSEVGKPRQKGVPTYLAAVCCIRVNWWHERPFGDVGVIMESDIHIHICMSMSVTTHDYANLSLGVPTNANRGETTTSGVRMFPLRTTLS